MKTDVTVNLIQSIFDEVVNALLEETLGAGDDEHVSWTPGEFDSLGWSKATELLGETLQRVAGIQRESAERLTKSGERGTPATVAILGFETGKSREWSVAS